MVYIMPMDTFIIIFIVAGMLLTVGVLGRGIYIMASGKDISGKASNKMMWYRVLFQGLTVLGVVILLLFLGGQS